MYVDILRRGYLPAVAKLEKKSYPAELALGLQSFLEDYESYDLRSFSRCIFENGELVCYILGYLVGNPLTGAYVYISDINCPNPRYLQRLLLNFFYAAKRSKVDHFHAEMRENSYRLLANQEKRCGKAIQILEHEYVLDYYPNGEGAHCVTFKADIEEYLKEDWKSRFQLELDNTYLSEDSSIFRTAFGYLDKPVSMGIDFYEKKNMRFVINSVKELILGYYQMFGEVIPAKLQYFLYERFSTKKKEPFRKAISTLESYGYKQEQGEDCYSYDSYRGILTVSRKAEIYNTKYRNSLAGFRWLRRKNRQYLSSSNKSRWFVCYNRYGVSQCLVQVPYLSQKQYCYYLRKLLFEMRMEQRVKGNRSEKLCFRDIVRDVYSLLRGQDAEECIKNIVGRQVDSAENYYHDWGLVIADIKAAREVLTEGAIKTVLMRSYNYALQECRNINAVRQIVLISPFTRRMFDVKKIRKEFSFFVRKNKSCDGYIRELSEILTVKYSKKLSIPLSEKNLLGDFIERMRKYCPTATIYSVHQILGIGCLSKFMKGTYPCVFRPKEITQSFHPLTEFISKLLKNRTRQAKHVYRRLREEKLLSDVLEGHVSFAQYQEILKILMHHNVFISNTAVQKLHEFRTVVERKGSPEFLVAGDASVCCMSFGSAKAVDYALEEGFGIINVYYKDRVIANSLIWINEPYQCLVLDNIEVHPNYTKFRDVLKNCFQSAAKELMEEYTLYFAVQGISYNDIQLYDDDTLTVYFDKMKPVGVKNRNFYSDATGAKVIAGYLPAGDRHLLLEVRTAA